MAEYLDRVLTLLPFEPDYFRREGLAADFVGHPVLESGADRGDGAAFRGRHGIAGDAKLLALLPGSRASEVARHLPVLRDTAERLAGAIAGLRLVMPTVPHLAAALGAQVSGWRVAPLIVTGEDEKFDAFAAADAAVAASGTVALELALAGTPNVVIYRFNALTAAIARRLVKGRFANLVNILLDEEAVPELLLDRCRADLIAPAVRELLSDPAKAARQRERARQALAKLTPAGRVSPSRAAARAVLRVLAEKG
jgi:lipid-A-disaccharide synthase